MATTVLVGSTGLVGSHILTHLLSQPAVSSIYAFSRRDLPNPSASPKLFPIVSSDNTQWASQFPRELSPKIFFSGLGTTRAQAGGLDAQRKIDLDLNLELAKAAKEAGVDTYVLISSGGASSASRMPYLKMKGELEDKVKELGFKHTVILKPGMIIGDRQDTRYAEAVMRNLAKGLRAISGALTDGWAQDADAIAKAAVNAGVQCLEGKKEGAVWEVGQAEILKLAKEL